MIDGKLCFDSWLFGKPLFEVQVVASWVNAMWLHLWMLSESIDESTDGGTDIREVEGVPTVFPWAVFQQNHSLKDWIAVNINVVWMLAANEVLAIQVPLEPFLEVWEDGLHLLEFFLILESRKQSAPETT